MFISQCNQIIYFYFSYTYFLITSPFWFEKVPRIFFGGLNLYSSLIPTVEELDSRARHLTGLCPRLLFCGFRGLAWSALLHRLFFLCFCCSLCFILFPHNSQKGRLQMWDPVIPLFNTFQKFIPTLRIKSRLLPMAYRSWDELASARLSNLFLLLNTF